MDIYFFLFRFCAFPFIRLLITITKQALKGVFSLLNASFELNCRRETFRDLSIKKERFYVSIFESRLSSDSKMSFCILPLEFLWKIFGRISRIVL